MASMTIRAIEPDRDADQIVALLYATNPTMVTNAAEWLHRRASTPERTRLVTFAAEVNGRIVGSVNAGLDLFGSGEIARLDVRVEPTSRLRGIGSELYRLGIEHVLTLDAKRVATTFDESEAGVAFARSRGWEEASRRGALDPRPADGLGAARPHDRGRLRPAPLPARSPSDRRRGDAGHARGRGGRGNPVRGVARVRLAQPALHARRQFRSGDRRTPRGRVAAARELPVAPRRQHVHRDEPPASRPRARRAVKIASARWAADNSITQIVTTNDETNGSMLAINGRLGYTPAGRRVEYLIERERLPRQRGQHLRRDPHRGRDVPRRVAVAAVRSPQPREVGEGAGRRATARSDQALESPRPSTARRSRGRGSARTRRPGSGSRVGRSPPEPPLHRARPRRGAPRAPPRCRSSLAGRRRPTKNRRSSPGAPAANGSSASTTGRARARPSRSS